MATQSLIQPYCAAYQERKLKGGPEFPHFTEAASQTFGIGDFIYQTSGTMAICTINGSNQMDSAVAGQAKKAASGVTGASLHFYAIRPEDEFFMNVYHATPASAITAKSLLGTIKGIVKISGKWHVDIENAAEGAAAALGRVIITDFPTKNLDGVKNTIGDTYGLVVCQFIQRSIATDGDPNQKVLQLWP